MMTISPRQGHNLLILVSRSQLKLIAVIILQLAKANYPYSVTDFPFHVQMTKLKEIQSTVCNTTYCNLVSLRCQLFSWLSCQTNVHNKERINMEDNAMRWRVACHNRKQR